MNTAPREEAIAAVLVPMFGDGAEVHELKRLPGGSSRETWSFLLRSPAGERRLVLRRDPPGLPSAGLASEAGLLAAATAAGVPVPALVVSGDASGHMGTAFVIVDYVEGETLPRRVLRLAADCGTGEAMAAQCGRILAALHAIAPATVPGLPGGDALEQLRGALDHLGEPHPALELGLRRLASRRPSRTAETVVHGDFRTGNLIVGADGIRAVLDWELAHRGDPLEDLAWLCAPAWRFGSPLPVGGFGSLDVLVGAYQEAGGVAVDGEALRWWVTLAALRWGVICMVQAHTHLSGALRSLELAAIGRRTCEAEWDVLELLP